LVALQVQLSSPSPRGFEALGEENFRPRISSVGAGNKQKQQQQIKL
jgi:hypothetical protein